MGTYVYTCRAKPLMFDGADGTRCKAAVYEYAYKPGYTYRTAVRDAHIERLHNCGEKAAEKHTGVEYVVIGRPDAETTGELYRSNEHLPAAIYDDAEHARWTLVGVVKRNGRRFVEAKEGGGSSQSPADIAADARCCLVGAQEKLDAGRMDAAASTARMAAIAYTDAAALAETPEQREEWQANAARAQQIVDLASEVAA